MTRWEYTGFEVPLAMKPEEYLEKVNALGKDGWEVYKLGGWCWLKRRIDE